MVDPIPLPVSETPFFTPIADREVVVRLVAASRTFRTDSGLRPALRDLHIEIRQGERVALLGASGSGKSTLLRCLCGLETIDAGAGRIELFGRPAQVDGRPSAEARALHRQVGMVFQQFNLVGRASVMRNVLAGRSAAVPLWRSLPGWFPMADRVRALQALDAIGLSEQAFQRASTLSGGQQQRAARARALVQGARVLLADEPVASLDPESTRRVMELLQELHRTQGLTLIASLHHVGLARRHFDRVLALRDGTLLFDGPTGALTPEFLRQLYGTDAGELLADADPADEIRRQDLPERTLVA